jgi:CheY-like chemotaxis protein
MAPRILVVDDSPTIRTVVSTILERCGYDARVASDGQDAYEALASGEVTADLVLLDFVMPQMNGYEFCRALRANPTLAAMPVILMSAKADRIRDQFVEQTGAMDAITKPFDREALVAVIEHALQRAKDTKRSSSARLLLPEPRDAREGRGTVVAPAEHTTPRAQVAQAIAERLATLAARALAGRPGLGAPELAKVLAEPVAEAVPELVEMVGDLDRVEHSPPILSGDLGIVPIGAVLQLLQAENQTGVLVCRSGAAAADSSSSSAAWQERFAPDTAEVRATFREGFIDLVQSTGVGDEFRLGRYFVEEGILTPEQIDAISEAESARGRSLTPSSNVDTPVIIEGPTKTDELEALGPDTIPGARRGSLPPTQKYPGMGVTGTEPPPLSPAAPPHAAGRTPWTKGTGPRPLGSALLAAGKIVESQLRAALTRQSSELLYEVIRWRAGRFELLREPPSELAMNAQLGLPVATVVMEGFRRVDEWRALERTLGSFDAVLFRDDVAFGALRAESLPAKERAVLAAVDGQRTVRQIVAASHVSSFDACRILVQFLEARVLRRRLRSNTDRMP